MLPMAGRPPLPLGTHGRITAVRLPGRKGWQARAKFRDLDGVTRRVTRAEVTKGRAENALREALRDRATSGYRPASSDTAEAGGGQILTPASTVRAIAETWYQELREDGRSPGTLRVYRGRLDNDVLPRIGSLRGRELRTPAIDRCLGQIRTNNGASAARTAKTVISGICGFAARKGCLGANVGNPARDARRISTKPKRTPFALDAAGALQLRTYLTYDNQAIVRDIPDLVGAMLATGQRMGEVLAIADDAFDEVTGTVEVRGTVIRIAGEGLLIKPEPKTEAGLRKLLLSSWAVQLLAQRFRAHKPTQIRYFDGFTGDGAVLAHVEEHTLLFPSTRFPSKVGLRDPSNVDRQLDDAFRTAGFDGLTSHTFRKTCATLMDDAGIATRHVADQLGQSRTSITQDVYLGRKTIATKAAAVLENLALPDH